MFMCELDEYTANGDCDRCVFGALGECHLQCTQDQYCDECDGDCVRCMIFCITD